ncbi:MAG: hypothetical protein LBV00_01740 [Propionibacteriaceae bacterium]|jgi:hypothetical protein|nr:hypothetical protein [Propionibacteriaceae bacterium]
MGHPVVQRVPNPAIDDVGALARAFEHGRYRATGVLRPITEHLDAAWQGETPERMAFATSLSDYANRLVSSYDATLDSLLDAYRVEWAHPTIERTVWVPGP